MSYESPDNTKSKLLEDRNHLQINLAEYALSKKGENGVKNEDIEMWVMDNSKVFGDLFDTDPTIEEEYEKVKDLNPNDFYERLLQRIALAKEQK